MEKDLYIKIEAFMQTCMKDSAHDREHIYRVLRIALEIAAAETFVDEDVLVASCLLHDIGRAQQTEDPTVCHAEAGSKKAYFFLKELGFSEEKAAHCAACILTHRYRMDRLPVSIEAKILFDADKVEAAGALGVARTLVYSGLVAEPLYILTEDGQVSESPVKGQLSFFSEYKYKLEGIYDKFFTAKGAAIAAGRRKHAVDFYNALRLEVEENCHFGEEKMNLWKDEPSKE